MCVNRGALPELVEHGRTGLLTECGDIREGPCLEEFIGLLETALNMEDKKREEMRLECAESARQYHYPNLTRKFMELIGEWL